MRLQSLAFLLISIVLSSCSDLKQITGDDDEAPERPGVFQLYSGKLCVIEDKNGKELRTNCENLKTMLHSTDKHCQSSKFKPFLGRFSDQPKPIQLCRDRSHPEWRTAKMLRIAIFADAGRGEDKTSGYGQTQVGEALAKICQDGKPCDFALVSGDLIYPAGVSSVWDKLFDRRFEKIYADLEMPFFMVAGNHDYDGNITAMLEYTYFSDRWMMPDLAYYIDDLPKWLSIYGMDSVDIMENDASLDDGFQLQSTKGKSFCQNNAWHIIFGHHPPVSLGNHGGEAKMLEMAEELEAKCGLDFFIGGHNHSQEYLQTENYDVIVQGAGGAEVKDIEIKEGKLKIDSVNYWQRFGLSAHGFAIMEITEDYANTYYYNADLWDYEGGEFTEEVEAKDYVFHCRRYRDRPAECN